MIQKSELNKGEVLVTPTNDKQSFSFSVETLNHSSIADEPKELGGDDLGMSPFDLLSASLATCTAMTLRFYAKRKNFDLGHFQVKVSIQKNDDGNHIFTREIVFEESKNPELINKFKEIAEKCPIHKALTSQINILTHVDMES